VSAQPTLAGVSLGEVFALVAGVFAILLMVLAEYRSLSDVLFGGLFAVGVAWRGVRTWRRGRPLGAWPGIVVGGLGAAGLVLLAALGIGSDWPHVYETLTLVAAAAAASAVTVWVVRSTRTHRAEPAGTQHRQPKLAATAYEAGRLVAVVAAIVLLVVWWAAKVRGSTLEPVLASMLAGAAALRLYRLTRAGSLAVDRLAAALVLVPAGSLLLAALAVGAVSGIAVLTGNVRFIGLGAFTTSIVHLLAGTLALAAMTRWFRPPPS
jgi:hypothetical protein